MEVRFQNEPQTVCWLGFLEANGEAARANVEVKVSSWDEEAQAWKELTNLMLPHSQSASNEPRWINKKIPACHTTSMRFEFEADVARLAFGQIRFLGPPLPDAPGRRDWVADQILIGPEEKSQDGPFTDMPLGNEVFQRIAASAFNRNKHVPLDGSTRIDWLCKDIANGIYGEWAVATNLQPMKGKWAPIVMVSVH